MSHAVGTLSVQAPVAGCAQGSLPLDRLSLGRPDDEAATYCVADRLAWSLYAMHSVVASSAGERPKFWMAMDLFRNAIIEKNTRRDEKKIHMDERKKSRYHRR